jgi:hypothetical protein
MGDAAGSAVDTLGLIATEIANVFLPLERVVASPDQVVILVNSLGWEMPPGSDSLHLAGLNFSVLIDKIEAVENLTPEELSDTATVLAKYGELIAAIAKIISDIADLVKALINLPPDYLSKTKFIDEFVPRLLDYLIVEYVAARSPPTYAFLALAGLIEIRKTAADPASYRSEHLHHYVYWERLGSR